MIYYVVDISDPADQANIHPETRRPEPKRTCPIQEHQYQISRARRVLQFRMRAALECIFILLNLLDLCQELDLFCQLF